jgi:hypothetical protein
MSRFWSSELQRWIYPDAALNEWVEKYVREYSMDADTPDGREGAYVPTDRERDLIRDAIFMMLHDAQFVAKWAEALK